MLLKDGKLDHLKDGPVYWVDSSDVHPCIGTTSAAIWTLKCHGRLFHSGLPHKVSVYLLWWVQVHIVCVYVCECRCE